MSEPVDVVDEFNTANPIPALLEKYGYTPDGNRWTAPGSKSPPGVSLMLDGKKWFSTHESDAGIGQQTPTGTLGDAFDLFTHYDHNGDRNAALKAVTSPPPGDVVDDAEAPLSDEEAKAADVCFENERKEREKEKKEKKKPQKKPDHHDFVLAVLNEIGRENILAAHGFVYEWNARGVWERMEGRAVKQAVLKELVRVADSVHNSFLNDVTDMLTTKIHKKKHVFNLGGDEVVNCENGELSLIDGDWKLLQHNREHYRTTQIPVKYDAEAQAPRFEQFLREVFQGDPDADEKRQAILEMMGYSLMTHCRYERFVILVGGGANGKSVLLAVLEALLGRANVAGVQPSQFDRPFQRAHLDGKLANVVTEVKQGEIIDDASLKGIVSGELTTVEHKYKNPFDIHPYCTCWFGTNHMPQTRDFSPALYRRSVIIQFNRVFKPEMGNCDTRLKEKLLAELPGILKLSLDAYARAVQGEFTTPASCKAARDDWRLEADQVAQFVEDRCERIPGWETELSVLFSEYKIWATASNIHNQVKIKTFGDRLVRLDFTRGRVNRARLIVGIALTPSPTYTGG